MSKKSFQTTLLVAALNFLGMGLSFGLNIFIAAKFGSGSLLDAYYAAISIPEYVNTVLAGAIVSTFIPIYAQFIISSDDDSKNFTSTIFSLIVAVLGTISLLSFIFSKQIIGTVAPGFPDGQALVSAHLLRIYCPVVIFTCLNEFIASMYYAKSKFAVPLVNKLIGPLISILILVLSGSRYSTSTLATAVLIGAIIQFFILFTTARFAIGFRYRPVINIRNQNVRNVLKLIMPLIGGAILYKIVPVYDRMILSDLPSGSISVVSYANRLQLSIASVISAIFSVQIFSLLSNLAAEKKMSALKEKMSFFISLLLFIAIPIAVVVLIMAEDIVRILLQRGAFTAADTIAVTHSLQLYMLGLPAVAIGAIVSQGLYVLQDTRTTMIVGIFETFFYLTVCYLSVRQLSFLGVPFTFSLNFIITVSILGFVFRKRLGLGGGKTLAYGFVKQLLAAAFAGLTLYFFHKKVYAPNTFEVFAQCVYFIGCYLAFALVFKVSEAQSIIAYIRKNKQI